MLLYSQVLVVRTLLLEYLKEELKWFCEKGDDVKTVLATRTITIAFGRWVVECICNIPKHDSNKFRRTLKFVNITSALLCDPLHGWKNYFINLLICWLPRLLSLIMQQLIGVNQPIMQHFYPFHLRIKYP